jgi:hypothetical protein
VRRGLAALRASQGPLCSTTPGRPDSDQPATPALFSRQPRMKAWTAASFFELVFTLSG